MSSTTAIIKAGERIAQLPNARTITLSSVAKVDLQITIKPISRKELRSNAQNKLAWMWASHLAKELGTTKEHQHIQFKAKHLAPILARDDADFAGFWAKFGALGLFAGFDDFWERTANSIVSSADANTKQMAEALTEWEMDSASKGFPLPQPEDYKLAIKHDNKDDED